MGGQGCPAVRQGRRAGQGSGQAAAGCLNVTAAGRRVLIGRIVGLYGVQGWLKIESWAEPRMRIFDYQPWLLSAAPGGETQGSGAKGREQGKGMVAQLPGVDDREQAAAWIGSDIYVSRDQLPPPAEGEYYWVDLEGLEVITTED